MYPSTSVMYILLVKLKVTSTAMFVSNIETGVHHKSARFKLPLTGRYDGDGHLRPLGGPPQQLLLVLLSPPTGPEMADGEEPEVRWCEAIGGWT